MCCGHFKPKMISAPCPCQFLRLRSQDFSSECFHTLDNTTRLTSAHWHASLWSTSPFPPCSHAALPQRVRTETLFSAVRRRKDLKFALQFSKIPSRKVSGLGCLVLQGFSSLYHKYPFLGFWSVARIPSRKVFGLGLIRIRTLKVRRGVGDFWRFFGGFSKAPGHLVPFFR